MELYKREHRCYILRRMVYELFGVGGEEWVRWWCRQGDNCYQIKFAGAVRNNA